jgi:hypothetical protein
MSWKKYALMSESAILPDPLSFSCYERLTNIPGQTATVATQQWESRQAR